MASELVRQLVDSGIHYGHRVSRWNPKMAEYIFGKRSSIHIIDIRETVKGLLRAKRFIARTVAGGEDVLFVGTKRQAKPHIEAHANRVAMPYVSERWLGGTLTNFKTIRSRLGRLEELEKEQEDGTAAEYSKKMRAMRGRELRKIKRNLEGIRTMKRLPGALVVIDVEREHLAVREARKLHIPTVCLIDTDSDPGFADIPIPGNDDAMRGIEVILSHLADSVEEGQRGRQQAKEGAPEEAPRRRSRRSLARADEGGEAEKPEPAAAEASAAAPSGESAPEGGSAPEGQSPEGEPRPSEEPEPAASSESERPSQG